MPLFNSSAAGVQLMCEKDADSYLEWRQLPKKSEITVTRQGWRKIGEINIVHGSFIFQIRCHKELASIYTQVSDH